MNQKQFEPILTAEDGKNGVSRLDEAISKAGLKNELVVMRDGQEAMRHLEANPGRRYGLLLTEATASGFNVLEWLANRPELKDTPIIVLAASSMSGSNGVRSLVALVQEIQNRWLTPAVC